MADAATIAAAFACAVHVSGLAPSADLPRVEIRSLTLHERLAAPRAHSDGSVTYDAIAVYDWTRRPPVVVVEPGQPPGVLAHELCHHLQFRSNRPFDEGQCEQVESAADSGIPSTIPQPAVRSDGWAHCGPAR